MSFVPQTTFNLYPQSSQLGKLYKTAANTANIRELPALNVIQPGDLLERLYDATSATYCVRPAQSPNGALIQLAGVAIYRAERQPFAPAASATGYQIGDMVPHCRQGSIFAKWVSADGTTGQIPYTTPNYLHSTTAGSPVGASAATNGAFTDKATASTAGSEVDACPATITLEGDQTGVTPCGSGLGMAPGFGVCLVTLMLP